MKPLTEEEKWLIGKIKIMEESTKNLNSQGIIAHADWPIHKHIWRGNYDVWSCDQDRINAIEIPRARMKAAEEDGLITTKGPLTEAQKTFVAKYPHTTIWSLTELGEQRLHNTP